ncbi:His-Xaa-Ser repeat protein HxsA [Thalassovita autumnalis]|uniref:His-Xaa-Ser repeat protein HxsA n=1 Tax=Thalassovita autumnalis TaxID=2072972 RepID=A0A0P1FWH7_9RHOB|nr:peptidoglycan-binding domain-containing protein [Thalassovita autumnalis]CUH68393.1 His-Xaa-Ser repeat protein HxsA [Thalassovita autumnalis]CUH73491.1 His-Xaa-Ser repeat protein HxsA [Thalassovita autumnalis]
MFSKPIKTALAASFVLTTGSAPVLADNLGAAIVGGLIGGAIMNEANKNKRKTYSSSANTAARAQNRETQTSLNYFGFPAGTPDGVMGKRSRQAVAQYQAFMGFPATGKLTQYERDFLISSYSRAQIGGPQVIKAMQGPNGVRSLLQTWRNESLGGNTTMVGMSNSYGGLPVEVSQAIDEIAASSDPSADQLMQRTGFMQLADLNGDGKNDYILDTAVSGSNFWCGPSNCTVMVFASSPQGYQRNDFLARGVTTASFQCQQTVCRMVDAPSTTMAATQVQPAQPAQPVAQQPVTQMAAATATQPAAPLGGIQAFNLAGDDTPEASLASHCSKISLMTNSNGGFVTLANLRDPDLALGEQFCLTRTYAIGNGETLVAKVKGATAAQIDAQCDAFGPAAAPYIAMLTQKPAMDVVGEVQKFVLGSSMSLEQLQNTAQICLYSGYRRDTLDVALGSAMLMVGTGQAPYAELIGHHLSQGFGVETNSDLARGWYELAVAALEAGAEPAFAPAQPERVALIKAASEGLGGAIAMPASSEGGLPSFSLE